MRKLFSYPIIKQSFRSAWVWWLISIIVISLNLYAFPSLEGVDTSNIIQMFADNGLAGNGNIFIIICAVMYANSFITSEVDKGTMAITLNTPITRLQLLLSKAIVYVFVLISICLIVGINGSISPILYGVDFDHGKWWSIVTLWSLYSFASGGIAFAIACLFNKSRYAVSISSAILGAFFILNVFGTMESFEFCKYLTLQTLFDVPGVIAGKSVALQIIALPIIAIPLYTLGIIRFLKKDLPL